MNLLALILFLSFFLSIKSYCGANSKMCEIAGQYYCCPGTICPASSNDCIGYCPNMLCADKSIQECLNDGFQCDQTFVKHVCNQDCFNAGGQYCGDFGCCFQGSECQSDSTCKAITSDSNKYSINLKQINWLYLYWQSTDGTKMKVCLSSSSSEDEDCISDFSTMQEASNYFKHFGKFSDQYVNPKITFHCDETKSCDFKYMIQTREYNNYLEQNNGFKYLMFICYLKEK